MPDNRKSLIYGAFPVCRNYTVRALLRQPIAERGRADEADSRVVGPQRYFYHGEYLRASGFAVQEPERPDNGKHADIAESAERKRMVR